MAALESFTWCTQVQAGGGAYSAADNVREMRFGNGLRQVASAGFNTRIRTFPIVYAGKEDEFTKVEKFVWDHMIKPFAWRTPRGDLSVFTVVPNSVNVKPLGSGSFELTCSFEEFYS